MSEASFLLPDAQSSHITLVQRVWPMVKAQNMAGRKLVLKLSYHEDKKTDAQRRYYHGHVLTEIAKQAKANGQTFPMPVWKEFFRDKFLGTKRKVITNPLTGRKSRRSVRVSTEDIGIRRYAKLIEEVTAFAATELGVTFVAQGEWVDPDTGEIHKC